MDLNDDDFQTPTTPFSADPSVTESQDCNQSEFSVSGLDTSVCQRNDRKLSRMTYSKVLNLKALIDATEFIDNLLRVQSSSQIQFKTSQLPTLRNTFNTHELIQQAEKLLERTSKSTKKAQVTTVTTTKIDYATDTKQAIKKAINIINKIYQAENGRFIDIFTYPLSEQEPNYYQLIKQPICFAFIAMRMRVTQEVGDFIEDRQIPQNLLLDINKSQYGSMLEQRQQFEVRSDIKSITQLMKAPVYNVLTKKPMPYTLFDEILADLLLMAADCLYYNNRNELYSSIGRQLFETIRDVFEKQNLWNEVYNDILEIDVITRICMKIEKTPFDDLKIDELSDETVKHLIKLLGPEDSETSREDINNANMKRTIAFIEEKQLLQKQSKQRVLTMKEFSNSLQLTQAGTNDQKNSVDEQNVLDDGQ